MVGRKVAGAEAAVLHSSRGHMAAEPLDRKVEHIVLVEEEVLESRVLVDERIGMKRHNGTRESICMG